MMKKGRLCIFVTDASNFWHLILYLIKFQKMWTYLLLYPPNLNLGLMQVSTCGLIKIGIVTVLATYYHST